MNIECLTAIQWDQLASRAPIVTATAAVTAVIIATISILVQRSIARKRAAIDFFLKTEMDDKLLIAYDDFNKGISALAAATSIEDFSKTDEYQSIRKYLYIHELMAVGIRKGIFDKKVCHDFWSDVLTRAYRDAKRVIDYVQSK